MYDFINLGKKGVNWASNLASYNRILNEESKEELGCKSPFEVYCGRKSNILVKGSLKNVADFNDCIIKAQRERTIGAILEMSRNYEKEPSYRAKE